MFFDGNLHLENGHGMSTFFVSGNITTGGSFQTWALNYGGYEKICEGDPEHLNKSADIENRYQTEFADHYPRSFCNIGGETYIAQKLGNIALAAGGRHPSNPTSYVGGDITLGASSVVIGSVFAGNHLFTEGDVDIRGLLSGSGDGDQTNSDTGNVFTGSTSINLQVEGDFDPTDLPIVDGEYHIPLPNTPAKPAITITAIATSDNPMRHVRAFTVRLLLLSSFTRKNSPENRLTTIARSRIMIISFTSNISFKSY